MPRGFAGAATGTDFGARFARQYPAKCTGERSDFERPGPPQAFWRAEMALSLTSLNRGDQAHRHVCFDWLTPYPRFQIQKSSSIAAIQRRCEYHIGVIKPDCNALGRI